MTVRVTILGCGGSQGVPTAAGFWGACDPCDPRNRRMRSSLMVEAPDRDGQARNLLIDTSPDLRTQLLTCGTARIDAVLFTHHHADHLHGIDELRSFNRRQGGAIPIHAAPETLANIEARFGYVLTPIAEGHSFYKPMLVPHAVTGPFDAAGVPVVAFRQDHGFSETLGFRIGAFAYSIDVVRLGEAALTALAGVELWIVDCLRIAPEHPTHAHLERTLEWIGRVRPKRAILSHMDIETDYATLARLLPAGVEPGIDGMVIEV